MVVFGLVCTACGGGEATFDASLVGESEAPLEIVHLPAPSSIGELSLEEALEGRRSLREYTRDPVAIDDLSQLLWAAQGLTQPEGRGRTAPSAGGTYPLELYVVTPDALHHYVPEGHLLETVSVGDLRGPLAEAALGQTHVADAPAVVVVTAVYARTEERYGDRAERYVQLEAGHAAQNLLLQAVALDLGAVPVGAFRDDEVVELLGLPADHAPLYLIPVGHPASEKDALRPETPAQGVGGVFRLKPGEMGIPTSPAESRQ
jgi:SagB-type dehydrogenase family enzyme